MKDWNGDGPLPTLYSKTATGAVNVWQCWVEDDYVCVRWGQLQGAMQDARFKCTPKNEGKKNATTGHTQAVKEAQSKWTKQIRLKYSETLETAGETARFKPMLAKDYKGLEHGLVYPVAVQPKFDGLRCLAYTKEGEVYLQSRGGKPWLLPHLQQEMRTGLQRNYTDFVFDGELYIHGVSLQDITSLARAPREESAQLYYVVYDCFCERLGVPYYKERWGWLSTWFTNYGRFFNKVVMCPTYNARDPADVKRFHDSFVEQGYEGAIVRTYDGAYRLGCRSADLLKVKEWEDDEFRIIDCVAGKGKFENQPIFSCLTKEGKRFDVVPKGSAEARNKMLQNSRELLGQLLKVQYLGFTEEGKPRCARGVAIRDPSDL